MMIDYIDRQAAIDALWKELFAYEDAQEKEAVDKGNEAIDEWFLKVRPCIQTVSDNGRMAILELPVADVEPVRHGRWLYKPEMYDESTWECSECGEPYTLIDGAPVDNLYFYCPNCGATMDRKQDEENYT